MTDFVVFGSNCWDASEFASQNYTKEKIKSTHLMLIQLYAHPRLRFMCNLFSLLQRVCKTLQLFRMLAKTLPRTVHLAGYNVQNPGRVRAVSVLKLSWRSDFVSNFDTSTLMPHPKHRALIYVASLHPQQLSLRHVQQQWIYRACGSSDASCVATAHVTGSVIALPSTISNAQVMTQEN